MWDRSAEQDETQSNVKTSRENLSDGIAESKLLRDLGMVNESKNLSFHHQYFERINGSEVRDIRAVYYLMNIVDGI
jgi:hypothetical protein